MKTKLITLAALAAVPSMLSGAVSITSWSMTLTSEADDSTAPFPGTTIDNFGPSAIYPPSDQSVLANEGMSSVSTASADIDFTTVGTGLPANLGLAVTEFDLQFEAGVSAEVLTGTAGSSATSSVGLTFNVEVIDFEADFTFSQTGSDSDIRFVVNGVPAQNLGNTIRLGVGTYSVTFLDGAGASTDTIDQEASSQNNTQNYNLNVVEVVPEPSSALLGSLAALMLLRRRR